MCMEDAGLLLVIAPAPNAVPIRLPIANAITTIGADEHADIRLAHAATQWAVVRCDPEALTVRHLASGVSHRLAVGDAVTLDGITVACEARDELETGPAFETMAGELASAQSAQQALAQLLAGAIDASRAETGAVIISERGDYRVAVARDSAGQPLERAAELLSDTIVRDVLASGERVCLTNVAADHRYRTVPSVVSLHLRSVVCLPLRMDGKNLGALFLGRRDARRPFGDRVVADLKVLAAMAVPLLAQLRRTDPPPASDSLLGDSSAMAEVRRLIERVGPSDLSVLVLGDSGTGKELVARAIHGASRRASRPLIALNCASVPETLLGAELFGYAKGAFTGAMSERKGLIEAAEGSTLFLDEVGDMPLAMQAALLRVLEQREVKRLGETEPRPVDFRLIAATNRNLEDDVRSGRFREDLLFRLKELTLELPPLTARGDDVLLLAHFFLRQAEAQLGLALHAIGDAAARALREHTWPGNARELRAAMRRAAVLADHRELAPADLALPGGPARAQEADDEAGLGDLSRPLAQARDSFVRTYVEAVVERHGGNRETAAKALGIGVRTLYRHLS